MKKLISNKKAIVDLWGMLIAIAIIFILLFSLFYTTNDTIEYGVTLIDKDIEEGTDAMIHYEIKNGWFSSNMNEVQFRYEVVGKVDEEIVSLGPMARGENYDNYVYVDTSNLKSGEYEIMTTLWYTDGKIETKQLGLKLTIYESEN